MSKWTRFRDTLLDTINIREFYENMGVKIPPNTQPSNNWLSCYSAFGGTDKTPSAGINLKTGVYKDFRTNTALSLFDFIVAKKRATSWWEAAKTLAKMHDLTMPSKTKKHPEDGVEWQEWLDNQCTAYCRKKPGILPVGIKASGAIMCVRYRIPCFAWPILNENLYNMGWFFVPRNGEPFENGAPNIKKTFEDDEMGFIGTPPLKNIVLEPDEPRHLYWCEGITDMLALYSQWPDAAVFITNGGCSDNLTRTQFEIVKNPKIHLHLLADADLPGIRGFNKRATQLQEWGKTATFHCPPYEIKDDHGRDVRDWLQEHPYSEQTTPEQLLLDFADQQTEHAKGKINRNEKAHKEQTVQDTEKSDQSLLKLLGFDIIQSDLDGTAILECSTTRKRRQMKTLNISFEDYLAVGGYNMNYYVVNANEEEANKKGKISFNRLKQALSRRSASIANRRVTTIGDGIWNLGNEYYLTSDGEFYKIKNDTIVHVPDRVVNGHIVDIENCRNWCDIPKLREYMQLAKRAEWRTVVHSDFMKSVKSWVWSFEGMDLLAAGLFYATWIQAILPWRPIVLLRAESQSGKTEWFKYLADLYQDLTEPCGLSTVAGVIQSIKFDSTPLLIDEFDTQKEQLEMFQVLRATGAGQALLKGTADHAGKTFRLCHIPWLGGITAAAQEVPDINRIIELSLEKSLVNTFDRPAYVETREIGLKLLASVLVCMDKILENYKAMTFREKGQPRIDRYQESYSVPYSALCAILGYDAAVGTQICNKYFDNYLNNELLMKNLRERSDHHTVLDDILSAAIYLPSDAPVRRAYISQILTEPSLFEYHRELEGYGIACKRQGKQMSLLDLKQPTRDCFIAMNIEMLTNANGLLSHLSRWRNNRGLREVLKRLTDIDVFAQNVRVGGTTRYCLCFPLPKLLEYLNNSKSEG